MRQYDCQHDNVNSLEKELLFNEVIKLRRLIAEAEVLLDDFREHKECPPSLKNRAEKFLNGDVLSE